MPTPATHDAAHSSDDEVYRITAAPTAHGEDLSARFRKYTISMLIRTACFIIFVLLDHWTRWIFAAGAVFLPYIAVVLANAGRERGQGAPGAFDLGSAPAPAANPPVAPREHPLPAIEARITDIHRPGDRPQHP